MRVEVNETKIELPKYALVNGQLQSGYYSIQENDEIEFLDYYTVRQIAEFMDVVINQDLNIYVNNKLSDMDTKVYENFSVIWTMEELQLSDRDIYGSGAADTYANLPEDDGSYVKSEPRKEADPFEAAAETGAETAETPNQAGEAATAETSDQKEANPTGESASTAEPNAGTATGANPAGTEQTAAASGIPMSIQVMVNEQAIRLEGKSAYIFVDVFDYIDFDLSKPQGSGIVTELNGRNAQYMELIHSGDVIKIYWKD